MGNKQSFQQHNDFTDLQTSYTYEKKYSDSRFGEIKLLKENSTGQKILQKDFSSNTVTEFEDYIKKISDATALAHPNVLRVYGYNSKKEDLFCADFYKLSLFFESFDSDLEQEISKRRHTNDYFKEAELWYILDSVASACAYLQNNGIQHKDIRPFNVLISANKDYKITATNLFSQSYNPGYFGQFDDLEARSRYYSPELLQHFIKNKVPFNGNKNDVFALGMTMLEAGLLEKVEGVYNFDKLEVKEAPIREGLAKLETRYSPDFVRIVKSALDFNPETRLDFIRLDRDLSVYRRDIREKARGITGSPVKTTEAPVRSAPPAHHAVTTQGGPTHHGVGGFEEDELDHRVREAVKKSEAVIKRSSPTKHSNKHLDPYIQSYLRNDLRPSHQPILSQISPYLTSESKYTTTLTIEQPNYGRESQPINFNQPPPREDFGENIKRSAFIDHGASLHGQQPYNPPETYGHQPNLQLQQTVSFGQPPTGHVDSNYQAPRTYGHHDQNYLTHSGVSPMVNYGTVGSHYGTAADNYGISNYHATSPVVTTPHDVHGHDDLSRKIEERLRQSRQFYQ